jgi:iron complex outermembrane recepter protein
LTIPIPHDQPKRRGLRDKNLVLGWETWSKIRLAFSTIFHRYLHTFGLLILKKYNRHIQYLGLLGLAVIFAQASSAQGSIHGSIYEHEGHEAIPHATIYLPDLKIGIATDDSGHYHIHGLPLGKQLIEVKAIGYTAEAVSLDIGDSSTYDFELSHLAGELHEVVVSGMSRGADIHTSPLAITVLDRDELRQSSAGTVIEAVTRLPGVAMESSGPNIGKPVIRGLDDSRVLTLYDGLRQEGQQWGEEHGIEADKYHIDRVEVIKGPASIAYGSDALAGVVHMLPTRAAPEGTLATELHTDYATNNGAIGVSGIINGSKDGIDFMLRGSHQLATNYRNATDGRVYGTAYRWTAMTAAMGIHQSWGHIHLHYTLYDNMQEVPDGSRDSASRRFTRQITEEDTARTIVPDVDLDNYRISNIHQHVQHYRLYAQTRFYLGNIGSLDLNLGAQTSHRREYNHPQYTDLAGLDLELNTLNYEMKYHTNESKKWSISAGVTGMLQSSKVSAGTAFVVPAYMLVDVGPFVLGSVHIHKWHILAGIRYDMRHVETDALYTLPSAIDGLDRGYTSPIVGGTRLFEPQAKTYQGFTATIGTTWQAAKNLTLKLNVARGYRAPNISELAAHGIHPGSGIYQLAAGLSPEFNLQSDIGVDFHSSYFAFSVELFYNYVQHYIFNRKLVAVAGGDSTIVPGYETFQYAAGNAQLYGGEASIDIHPIHALHIAANVSIVMADLLSTGGQAVLPAERYLPTIPPVHGYTELRYEWAIKRAHLAQCYVKAGLEYYASQNRIFSAYNTETATAGYALIDMGLGIGITNKKGRAIMILNLTGTNLLNTIYQNHLSRLKYLDSSPINHTGKSGIYGMGRNIQLGITVPLSFKI